jgi:hypothetical protein
MAKEPEETRSWQDQDEAAQKAVDEMRRGLERVRAQVSTYRQVLHPEPEAHDEA